MFIPRDTVTVLLAYQSLHCNADTLLDYLWVKENNKTQNWIAQMRSNVASAHNRNRIRMCWTDADLPKTLQATFARCPIRLFIKLANPTSKAMFELRVAWIRCRLKAHRKSLCPLESKSKSRSKSIQLILVGLHQLVDGRTGPWYSVLCFLLLQNLSGQCNEL